MRFKKAILLGSLLALGLLSMPARADEGSMDRRLQSIEAKQETILSFLEEIRSEMQIIKVRSTQ